MSDTDYIRIRIPKALDGILAGATGIGGDKQAEARVLYALHSFCRTQGIVAPPSCCETSAQRRAAGTGARAVQHRRAARPRRPRRQAIHRPRRQRRHR